MPTYDYLCGDCGHRFDEFQGIKEEPLKKCPKCGKPSLRRQFGTGAGLIFKGSGFYITDYKKNGNESLKSDKQNKDNKENRENKENKENKENTESTKSAEPAKGEKQSGT